MSSAHLHKPRGLTLSLHLSPLVQQANLIPGAVFLLTGISWQTTSVPSHPTNGGAVPGILPKGSEPSFLKDSVNRGRVFKHYREAETISRGLLHPPI